MKINELPKPNSYLQKVLLFIICNKTVSFKDFRNMPGFRTRISELSLEYGLKLEHMPLRDIGEFGNVIKYVLHILPKSEKEKAIDLYLQLNKSRK